jgi:hypothetical protein
MSKHFIAKKHFVSFSVATRIIISVMAYRELF